MSVSPGRLAAILRTVASSGPVSQTGQLISGPISFPGDPFPGRSEREAPARHRWASSTPHFLPRRPRLCSQLSGHIPRAHCCERLLQTHHPPCDVPGSLCPAALLALRQHSAPFRSTDTAAPPATGWPACPHRRPSGHGKTCDTETKPEVLGRGLVC